MCLILFSYNSLPDYMLVLASNRDEFYDRPTRPMGFWEDHPSILGGRDEKNMGTWFGITRDLRYAAITNYRDPSSVRIDAPSRGLIVSRFLEGDDTPKDYLETLRETSSAYNGFNLLLGDKNGLYYYSNRRSDIVAVKPGIHGLSNAFLDTPWPKVEHGKQNLANLLQKNPSVDTEGLFDLLADSRPAEDGILPDTGVGLAWERLLSPLFIESDVYGTRASTVLLIDRTGRVTCIERSFISGDGRKQERVTRRFDF
jgi:uncharacterized protein with NRDE domain